MIFVTIVLDGVGIGAQPDADAYGDEGSHTLGHVCAAARPSLPNLAALGLGCITPLDGLPCPDAPRARYGRMQEVSAGKDSTTGHWELAGLRLDAPFPTYADGFPDDVIDRFVEATGCGRVLGNRPASGTAIVQELGDEHRRTGAPIVYTSADSVFQVAAHKDVVPLDTLYDWCRTARTEVCTGAHGVGRVIARPFVGTSGHYDRVSSERRDFSRRPERPPLHEVLGDHGVRTVSIGKIYDLFARTGFDDAVKTSDNAEGIQATLEQIRAYDGTPTFVWTNLVDFDQAYGHRNDPQGFAEALEAFDRAVPDLIDALPSDGRLVVTADHGNDPTTGSTDHAREYVPVLDYRPDDPPDPAHADLGLYSSFNHHAATVADFFEVPFETQGAPFGAASD
ncbi:MAG: phosphopentomutase [Salinibacter sp.]